MNKGGVGLGGGAGGGGGPSSSGAQKQKALLQRADTDIGNLVDNFGFLVNMDRVQTAGLLLKMVSELKQTAIFSGFASLNDHVDQRTEEFNKLAENTNSILATIGEDTAASLKELEPHYYSSTLRTSIPQQP